jgi:hypothetical protein
MITINQQLLDTIYRHGRACGFYGSPTKRNSHSSIVNEMIDYLEELGNEKSNIQTIKCWMKEMGFPGEWNE